MWISDEEFLRSNVPMTKFEIRVLSCALLNLNKDDVLLDIGSGTGSISIQARKMGADVVAIEKKQDAIDIMKKNMDKFNVDFKVYNKDAVDVIDEIDFNKCFIGGSDGKLKEIIELVDRKLKKNGVIVGNFITQNYQVMMDNLKEYDKELRIINVSKYDGLMFKANNPVFIVKAVKR